MGDTTGNQDVAIATNGSSHVPTAGPPDVCLLADKKTPVPFPNFVASSGNVQGGTTNTFIVDQVVWTQPAVVGPPSDPAHAGVGKGVASGTYRDEAKATSWSRDVKMEGSFVVRTGDGTTQNKANTTGNVMGAPLAAKADAAAEYKKLLCTIVKLDGECRHGRKLGLRAGAKKGEPNYLEILGGDVVKLEVERKDVHLDPPGPGNCTEGIHTKWVATRSASGEKEKVEKKEQSKDAFEVSGKLTQITGFGAKANEGSVEVGKTKVAEKSVGDFSKRSDGEADTYKRFDSPNRAGGSDGRYRENGGRSVEKGLPVPGNMPWPVPKRVMTGANNDLLKAARLWRALTDPPTIIVSASACSGSKTATLKVFPFGPFKLDLMSDKIEKLADRIKRAAQLGEKLGNAFGQPVKLRFLEGPALTFSCEYKELKKNYLSKPAAPLAAARKAAQSLAASHPGAVSAVKGYAANHASASRALSAAKAKGKHLTSTKMLYRVQVRRSWKLEFKFECLVAASLQFTVPLANFLGVAGAVVAKIVKLVGLEGNFFCKFQLEFNPSGNVSWNEYDVWGGAVKSEVVFTFSAGIQVYARIAEFTVYGYAKCTVEFTGPNVVPGYLFGVNVNGGIQCGIKGAARVNIWKYEASKDFDWKPDWLKWPREEGEGFLLPLVPEPS
jgi:hypothetical protein